MERSGGGTRELGGGKHWDNVGGGGVHSCLSDSIRADGAPVKLFRAFHCFCSRPQSKRVTLEPDTFRPPLISFFYLFFFKQNWNFFALFSYTQVFFVLLIILTLTALSHVFHFESNQPGIACWAVYGFPVVQLHDYKTINGSAKVQRPHPSLWRTVAK